ncbi:Acetophenone carboxylase alpha subunit [Nymphon striatum]|nr:Acetophenone carboxylase alpha subunit [Nymphon striatum]
MRPESGNQVWAGPDLHTGPTLVPLPVLRMWPESGTLAGSMRIVDGPRVAKRVRASPAPELDHLDYINNPVAQCRIDEPFTMNVNSNQFSMVDDLEPNCAQNAGAPEARGQRGQLPPWRSCYGGCGGSFVPFMKKEKIECYRPWLSALRDKNSISDGDGTSDKPNNGDEGGLKPLTLAELGDNFSELNLEFISSSCYLTSKAETKMSQIVIGVDVGGTNTDAVLMEKNKVIAWAKHFTTDDVTTGVIYAITGAISNALESGYNGDICQVNIGTTHYINAVIQRKNLSRVAVIRLCGPASRGLPPFSDFDNELEKASSYSLQLFQKKYIFTNISFFILQVINPLSFMVAGGYQYDGSEIYPVDFKEISSCLSEIDEAGICNVVVSGVFSVVRSDQEIQVRDFILKQYPRFHVTISSEIGTMNLLERENAAILNECLKDLCHKTCQRFQKAFEELNLVCPIFYTQNDGTYLSHTGLKDGIVLDIGGTSSDVGLIQNGFPREASTEIKIGGVTTNFRMPDVISGALGGGTIVKENKQDVQIGPISVGFNISSMAKVFGGNTLTTTDVAVAAGIADIGDGTLVKDIGKDLIQKSMDNMHSKIEDLVDQVKISPEDLPLIVVGGGSIIFDDRKEVANAVGAALTQIGGFVDEVMPKTTSIEELIEVARKKAIGNAVANGASEKDISLTIALYKNDAKFTLVPAEPNVDPVTGEWELSEWDVECIAIGAGILGCGGGGSPHIGRLMLLKTIAEGKRPRVIHPERLMKNSKADDVALLVAYYGSPTVLCEKLTSGNQSNIAVSGLTDIYKNRIYQNGTLLNNGMNAIEPLVFGAKHNLPVVDVDGVGRAVPELQVNFILIMTLFNLFLQLSSDDGISVN